MTLGTKSLIMFIIQVLKVKRVLMGVNFILLNTTSSFHLFQSE